MNELLYTLLVTVTIYHADPKQTDSTPFITASNKTIDSLKKIMIIYLYIRIYPL